MFVKKMMDNISEEVKKIPSELKKKSATFEKVRKLRRKEQLTESELRQIAESKFQYKKSFSIHLFFFVFGSILLFIINFLFSPEYLWAILAVAGWIFIGGTMHLLAYTMFLRGVFPMAKRGVYYHAVSYIIVNIYLVSLNILTSSYIWATYPIIFWGFGLAIHTVMYILFSSKMESDGTIITKRERAIEKEMNGMRKNISHVPENQVQEV